MKVTIDGINIEFDGELLVSRGESGEIRIAAPEQKKQSQPAEISDIDFFREIWEKLRELQPPTPVYPTYPTYPVYPTWPTYPTVPTITWMSPETHHYPWLNVCHSTENS